MTQLFDTNHAIAYLNADPGSTFTYQGLKPMMNLVWQRPFWVNCITARMQANLSLRI